VKRGTTELIGKGLLVRYVADSLLRVAWGYLTAAALGIPLGLLLGWYPAAAAVVNPTIQMLRPISPIAWIPLSIVWFGVGNLAAIFLIFLASFFPILVTSTNAVRNVPSMYRRAGRNFGLSPAKLIVKVVFPASLPQIIVGLRIALGIAWLVVVAAEMIAIDSGLGYLVIDSRNSGKRYDLVVAAMILIGLTGVALDTIFRRIEKLKSVRWGFRHES
jgi:NitT/TauT family transport system permease protein